MKKKQNYTEKYNKANSDLVNRINQQVNLRQRKESQSKM